RARRAVGLGFPKEKLQRIRETGRPSAFAVRGTVGDFDAKSFLIEAAACQDSLQLSDIFDRLEVLIVAPGLARSNAHKDLVGPSPKTATVAQDLAIRDPEGWTFQKRIAEHTRHGEHHEQGDPTAERRSTERGVLRAAGNSIALLHERHNFSQKKFRESVASRTKHRWTNRAVGQVFLKPLDARVVDANNNHRRDQLLFDQAACRRADLPLDSRE